MEARCHIPAVRIAPIPVRYTVLLLLDAAHGSLAEIELTGPDFPSGGASRWLWIEGNGVSTLRVIGSGNPSKRVFDRAVLMLDGTRGEMLWPNGRRDVLTLDPAAMLRPAFVRLVHQHLN